MTIHLGKCDMCDVNFYSSGGAGSGLIRHGEPPNEITICRGCFYHTMLKFIETMKPGLLAETIKEQEELR